MINFGLNKRWHFSSFPDDCRAWRKSDLFTLLVEVHRALFKEKNNVKPLEIGKQLLQFYELVDKSAKANEEVGTEHSKIQEYYKAAIQGTQSRSNRIRRGQIVKRKNSYSSYAVFIINERRLPDYSYENSKCPMLMGRA